MAATAALRPSFPRFPPALPPSLERRRPVLLLQSSAFIRRDSLSRSARNGKATSDRSGGFIPGAYVAGPASDAIFSESDPKFSASGTPEKEEELIGWGLLWSLLWRHRLRMGVALVTLIGCTTCTLSMPLFSGKFFEVLVGLNSEPSWRLLGKIGILYLLEPVFTVLFVVNINTVWEKVMSSMRALIFRRVLVQKVEFFDRYKVGELTGLLTSDLGSLKDVGSENV